MAVVKAEFQVLSDQIKFTTQTNGDRIEIKGIHLGKTDAANLAELINLPPTMVHGTSKEVILVITVKEKK